MSLHARWTLSLLVLLGIAACESEPVTPPPPLPLPPSGGSPPASSPFGSRVFGIDGNNTLIGFGTLVPDRVVVRGGVTGLQTGERILGIDFNPADRRVYGIGSSSRLYVIDTTTAAATLVGTGPLGPALFGTSFGVDVNPATGRLRVQSDIGENLRFFPAGDSTAVADTALRFAATDPNAGVTPSVVATAYTNSVAGALSTTLYAIDSDRDVLVRSPAPASGVLETVGSLGVTTTDAAGFDILGSTGTAYAALAPDVSGGSQFYTLDLTTGAATLVGPINHAVPLQGITVIP
jgi:3D (Asp-Asp-Asp) domain-containing protein